MASEVATTGFFLLRSRPGTAKRRMVRATTPSHTVGVVVARNPRRINRNPQAAPRTTITRTARRNVFKAFMPVYVRFVGWVPLLFAEITTTFHFIRGLRFFLETENESYERFTIQTGNLSDRE